MAKEELEPGSNIDGFIVGEKIHTGGMATLWRVTKPGIDEPIVSISTDYRGASAEVGRTNAGFVNVVTKSGSNSYRGDLFYSNRNEKFTSDDAFGNPSKNNSQHQTGGALGMQTLDASLARLVKEGVVTLGDAQARAKGTLSVKE